MGTSFEDRTEITCEQDDTGAEMCLALSLDEVHFDFLLSYFRIRVEAAKASKNPLIINGENLGVFSPP